jgi:hypothetical protein
VMEHVEEAKTKLTSRLKNSSAARQSARHRNVTSHLLCLGVT